MALEAEGEYDGNSDDDSDALDYDSPEDGVDVHQEREESFEDRIKAASTTIKRKIRFFDEGDVDDFFREHGDVLGKSPPNAARNLLHALVEVVKHTDGVEAEHVGLLVQRLVRGCPELLKSPNKDGYNPIFMAIRESLPQLVVYMMSTCVQDKTLDRHRTCLNTALSMGAFEGKTCLHVALKENFDPTTTRMLIENASDEALAVQDDLGKTPMHYAVSFMRSLDVRVDLIDLFIQRDSAIQRKPWPKKQKTFLDLVDRSGSSIYLEHQKTRASATKKKRETAATSQPPASDATKRDQSDIPKRTERPTPREPRPQPVTRDSRQVGSVKPARDHDTDRFGHYDGAGGGLDEREKLRREKRLEEDARRKESARKDDNARKEKTEPSGKTDGLKEQRSAGRDTNNNRPAVTSERDEMAAPTMARTNSGTQQQEPASNTSIRRSSTVHLNSIPELEKATQPTRPALTPGKSTRRAVLTQNSDKIMSSLKLHYMRTRNAEMATSFLYGKNMDDVLITFDYDRLPSTLQWNKFVKHFGQNSKSGLKFDPVLKYVTFPHVKVEVKGRLADLERDSELQSGLSQLGDLGRKDMKYFLDWLYEKGVRHIIKLSVEDSGDTGQKVHSDKVIQESTERFIVEQLDWQKTDLDPETILHVSSKAGEKEAPTPENPKNIELVPNRQLKQLYLRWSGSNAVLRAWSEPEGLPMLPQLERIHLFKPPSDKSNRRVKRHDGPTWIGKKLEQFGIRLNANRKVLRARETLKSGTHAASDTGMAPDDVKITIYDSYTNEENKMPFQDTPHSTTSAPVKGVNSHRWLDSTVRFAGEMIPFWSDTVTDFLKSTQNLATQERIEDDVVVALIDDGVDMFDTGLTDRVLEGKSFDFHDEKVRPPFSSARGHGTVMANMILRVCPMAKVYPIRLKTYVNADGKNHIDADYAAQAIQAALDKNATIISMSWTLPMTKDNNDSKDRLYAVLKKGVDKKVLMFCSAPDEGKFTELDYPSGPWRDRFFRIGAARADGTVFQWTPDDGITYVLPGVDVIKEQVGSSGSQETPMVKGVTTRVTDFKYETGSSVATALAAGLAAMIICCVKASIMAVKTANQNKGPIMGIAIPDNGATLIAEPTAMKRAFASLGKVTTNNFIQVWEELDKVSEVLETLRAQSSNPETKLKSIERFVQFGLKLANSAK